MSLISWSNEYSVSIQSIDEQHKKLVSLINELHDAMKAAKGKEVLGKTLEDLVAYTKFHFSSEEKLMADNGYADLKNHQLEHDKLTSQVMDFQAKYKSGNALLSLEIMQFLKSWLVNHIKGSDKAYSPYLKSKGVN